MSGSDAYGDEMRIFTRVGDRDQDRVLAGRTDAVGDDLRELAAFCQQTRTLFVNAPSESTAVRHLAEIAAAARNRVPAAEVRTRPQAPFASLGSRLALAGAAAALLAAFASGALAGVLPGSLQNKVAGIAGNVGLSLPGGSTHPPPTGPSNRPEADPAKPSADVSGGGATRPEPTHSGGDQNTQQSGGDENTHQSTGDQSTPQNGGDGAAQGREGQTTRPVIEGSGSDNTGGSMQPSGSGSPSTSGGSQPEKDSLPSDRSTTPPDGTQGGGNPAMPGDGSDGNG